MPTVSVIIPTCNRTELLRKAIESVANQSYTDWEILVIDDCPNERARELVAGMDLPIRYFTGESKGPSFARNLGLKEARGAFIGFLDDDDLLMPGNLEILSDCLKRDDGIGCAYGWYAWIDKNDSLVRNIGPVIPHAPLAVLPNGEEADPCGFNAEGDILAPLLLEESLLMGNSLIRREWAQTIGGFDTGISYQEHWDFYLRLAKAGCRFARVETMVSLHRLHRKTLTPSVINRGEDTGKMLAGRLTVLDRFLASEDLPDNLSRIRDTAYFNAYREFFRLMLRQQRPVRDWSDAFSGALQYASGKRNSPRILGADVHEGLRRVLDPDSRNRTIEELCEILPATPAAREACATAKGLMLLHRAKDALRNGKSRITVASLLAKTARIDPQILNTKKYWRLWMELFASPPLMDWFRFSRPGLPGLLPETRDGRDLIFLSPHFDDAVLSCGGLMALSPKDHTWLVTVFSDASNRNLSPLAKALHLQWRNDARPYARRQAEDTAVSDALGIHRLWLGFNEVIYRDPDLTRIEQVFSPTPLSADMASIEAIRERIVSLVREHPGCLVFAPMGLGQHRDHLVVHEAARAASRQLKGEAKFFFYEDFPYANDLRIEERLAEFGGRMRPSSVNINTTLAKRIELIKLYASQIKSLFGDESRVEALVSRYAYDAGTRGMPHERYWRDDPLPDS